MTTRLIGAGFLCLVTSLNSMAQTGNYVSSGSEITYYQTVDLAVGTWSTGRYPTPGYVGASSNASFVNAVDGTTQLVDGYIKQYATAPNQSFSFPVGAGTDLRTLEISGSRSNSSIIGAAWMAGDPSNITDPTSANALHSTMSKQDGISEISDAGQWDWIDFNENSAGVTVSVSIPDVTSMTAAASDLRLVGWSNTMNQWVMLGTTGTSSKAEGAILSGTMTENIAAIGIGSTFSTLPVSLSNFAVVKYQDYKSKLDWETLSEENTKGFEIERSADGSHWLHISFIPTQAQSGNSHVKLAYTTLDYSPLRGDNFYRLKIVNSDESFTYSQVKHIVFSNFDNGYVKVFPNPSYGGNDIDVELKSDNKGAGKIQLFNSIGQQILSQSININDGKNFFKVATGDIAAGTYYMHIIHNNKQIGDAIKLIKQ